MTNPPEPKKDEQAEAASAPPNPAPAKPLTPEEQMAAYEEDLKENDWGHQPC